MQVLNRLKLNPHIYHLKSHWTIPLISSTMESPNTGKSQRAHRMREKPPPPQGLYCQELHLCNEITQLWCSVRAFHVTSIH